MAACALFAGRAAFRDERFALATGAFVAWLPMLARQAAVVNNDVLAKLVASAVILLVGVKMMGHTSTFPELLRTLGFASAPQILTVAAVIPILGTIANLVAFVLGLVAYVIAVRQALDVTTGRAVLVCVLAVLAQIALAFILSMIGMGALSGARAIA